MSHRSTVVNASSQGRKLRKASVKKLKKILNEYREMQDQFIIDICKAKKRGNLHKIRRLPLELRNNKLTVFVKSDKINKDICGKIIER